MSDLQPSEALVESLARDLTPVSRIPRLRTVAGLGLLAWLAAAALHAFLTTRPQLGELSPLRVLVFAGLALAAAGGLTAALAAAVPGRETAMRLGRGVLLGGALLAGATAAIALWEDSGTGAVSRLPLWTSFACIVRSTLVGTVPGAVVGLFAARAFALRPALAGCLVALAAVSLGALAVHASCLATDPLHVLAGHALGPVAITLALALPLSWRLARR